MSVNCGPLGRTRKVVLVFIPSCPSATTAYSSVEFDHYVQFWAQEGNIKRLSKCLVERVL